MRQHTLRSRGGVDLNQVGVIAVVVVVGALYHERTQPPKVEGECDQCGESEFVHRPDDRAEVVATRFAAYRNQTAPILPYYRARGILRTVDGMAAIDEVSRQIEAVLGEKVR